MNNPYANEPEEKWISITHDLIKDHPLKMQDLVDVTLESWEDIFESKIGKNNIRIGKDIFPSPQIMGFFLHEIIPINFKSKPTFNQWTKDKEVSDKDLVYKKDLKYSIEIKTSSSKNQIFGNRSYSQPSENPKKNKSGFFLAINFEKFEDFKTPKIKKIRFGWLDHSDWIGQQADTGQQAKLTPVTYETKLLEIYPNSVIQ
jgi:hypothetical protein